MVVKMTMIATTTNVVRESRRQQELLDFEFLVAESWSEHKNIYGRYTYIKRSLVVKPVPGMTTRSDPCSRESRVGSDSWCWVDYQHI